ncbi:DoxX family protein [Belliella aquatica]|uniref:DoxX family protein n=1 Tax=Belliella aquatica TaxID=1323734 RepID=UPI001666CD3A|nr:DoxX family protein [Belliella aquatica]MCH7407448.1 hypothetical protein [Belliella aquatica]
MNSNTKNIIIEICALLLAALFFYTGISKILDADNTYYSLKNQVFPDWFVTLLFYTLPLLEIILAIALVIPRSRKISLWLSLILLTSFTAYIGIVLTGVFGRIPCSCGGVISQLTWTQHLFFNLFFLSITIISSYLQKNINSPPPQPS